MASFVVTATGSTTIDATGASTIVDHANTSLDASIIAAAGVGGLFVDRSAAAERSITAAAVATTMATARAPDGERLFADTFPSFAVSFARYC